MVWRVVMALLLLVAAYLALPVLVGNLSLTALTRSMTCTRYAPPCTAGVNDMTAGWRTAKGHSALIALVDRVRRFTPDTGDLALRQAELLSAQGEFAAAAELVEPLPLPVWVHNDETEMPPARSRLLINGLPENALLAAWQHSERGDGAGALHALRVAIATAPELLGDSEWELYTTLTSSGDNVRGASPDAAIEHELSAPLSWRGMDITAVRVEPSAFSPGGNGQVHLWLRVRSAAQPDGAVAADGGEWLLPLDGINLAPNPLFEWGSEQVLNGTVPAGYFALYTSSAANDSISFPGRDGNHALRIAGNGIYSISGYPVAVEPGALYLMGATVSTTGRFSIGNRCVPPENFPRHNLWVNPLRENDSSAVWSELEPSRAVAHANVLATDSAATCQLVLEGQGGESLVDNVFWVRIE